MHDVDYAVVGGGAAGAVALPPTFMQGAVPLLAFTIV